MPTVTFRKHHYGQYTRYSQDAFDNAIGKPITVMNHVTGALTATPLIAAVVADDGTYVDVTVELDQT